MRFVKSFVDAVSILPGGLKTDGAAKVAPNSAEMVETDSPLARIFTDLTALAERLNCQDDVSVAYTTQGLVMRLSDHALFDAGVADISLTAIPLLQKIEDWFPTLIFRRFRRHVSARTVVSADDANPERNVCCLFVVDDYLQIGKLGTVGVVVPPEQIVVIEVATAIAVQVYVHRV